MTGLLKFRRLIALTILPCIVLLLVNISVNRHYHVLSDGQVITHAHPFAKSTDGSTKNTHKHTAAEFLLLDILTNGLIFISAILAGIIIFGSKICSVKYYYFEHSLSQHKYLIPDLRAPPAI